MRSIGRPIAKLLAAAGAKVVITGTGRAPENYPDDEKAAGWKDIASVAEEIRGAGGVCIPLISDVSSETAVDKLVRDTVAELGRLDILVNNAGAARGNDRVPAIDLDYETWKKVLVTNLDGTFLLSRAAAKQLIAQGDGGSIVNISSIASKLAGANSAAYSASKAGINALSHAMAMELAPTQDSRQRRLPGHHRHLPARRPRPWRRLAADAQAHPPRLCGRWLRNCGDHLLPLQRARRLDNGPGDQRGRRHHLELAARTA